VYCCWNMVYNGENHSKNSKTYSMFDFESLEMSDIVVVVLGCMLHYDIVHIMLCICASVTCDIRAGISWTSSESRMTDQLSRYKFSVRDLHS